MTMLTLNPPSPHEAAAPPSDSWASLTLADLLLDLPSVQAQVELVDDEEAIIEVMPYDLLTELLCEV